MGKEQINPVTRIAQPIARWAALLCGWALMAVVALICIEIVARKLFNSSFQGVDEIGGYVMAVLSCTGFAYALVTNSHVRVDLLIARLPRSAQAIANILAMVILAGIAVFIVMRGTVVLQETLEFGSVSTSPLQTPLWIPQSLWLAGLVLFMLVAVAYAAHGLFLTLTGKTSVANMHYGPPSLLDEVEQEIAALESRDPQSETAP